MISGIHRVKKKSDECHKSETEERYSRVKKSDGKQNKELFSSQDHGKAQCA